MDDILITGKNDEEHLRNLQAVFKILLDSGLRLKLAKCFFMQLSVIYLGMEISKKGIQPVEEKVRAIKEAPIPKNTSELKSFLGMLTYYQRYMPKMAGMLEPLHYLLRKGVKWIWSSDQQRAFQDAKDILS